MKDFSISREEIINAIVSNDTVRIAEILDGCSIAKNRFSTPDIYYPQWQVTSTMLSLASIRKRQGSLSENLAYELMSRLPQTVDLFSFLFLVIADAKIKIDDFDEYRIPKEIRQALFCDRYNREIIRSIEELDVEIFKIMLTFIMSDYVVNLDHRFNGSIMSYIYEHKIIPVESIFVYMGLCPRPFVEVDVTNRLARLL